MSHQNTKQMHKNCVFCHLGNLKTISDVGTNILSLQLIFTSIKSPVWQRKSPVTGHEPDSKKCLICEPDLMFVTHLQQAKKRETVPVSNHHIAQTYCPKIKPKHLETG